MARINNEQQDYSSRNDIAADDLDDTHHGGDITSKRQNTLRIGFLNINGIPTKNDHPKNLSLYEAIKSHEMDVIGLAETNKCWHTLDTRDSWKSRTTGWWQASKATFAYNTTDCHSKKFQPGGTLQITNGRTTNRIIDSGIDTRKLGRWSWQRFRGKANKTVTVITAYRPCKSIGVNTTYTQQLRYFNSNQIKQCPRQIFMEDLREVIYTAKRKGDQIILMMDWNNDIRSPELIDWCEELGLKMPF